MIKITSITLVVPLTIILSHHLLAACCEAKKVADAINKQNNDIKRHQEEVESLLGRIVQEIECTYAGR